jgi:hypothetical protein
MGDFTSDQIAELYDQHVTGQEFTKDAVDRGFDLTQGKPWLVNALAYEITFRMGTSGTITTAQVNEAKERLIQERPVHLDALRARLYEPRVEQVIRAIMEGTTPGTDASSDDDVPYVRDLGLIRGTGAPEIANPFYQEFLLRHWFLFADLLTGDSTDLSPTRSWSRLAGESSERRISARFQVGPAEIRRPDCEICVGVG